MNELREALEIGRLEAGCDEAGRGCLAGPVVAAAVILPAGWRHPLIRDSKQLSAAEREEARAAILEHALAWAIGQCSPEEIDQINILRASFLAMHRALDQLPTLPEHLLIDGNRFTPWRSVTHTCVIKGDSLYRSIAAASILAKTQRDACMLELAAEFPQYGWAENKGYPTVFHRKQVLTLGCSPHHRKSFRVTDPHLQTSIFEQLP